ncbi:bifunctional epoxide hydrolase 2-like [Fagus crenata]
MDQIQHNFINVRGLKLHLAEIGSGPHVVVFLHGFPEIWYTWRHQMMAVANTGFRAIAPDYKGYGLSDPPPEPEKATFSDLISDLLGILDALQIDKAQLHSIRTFLKASTFQDGGSEIPIAAENQEIMDLVDPSTPLPPWFTEEDLAAYGALYEKSGFQTALQVPYRTFGEDMIMTDPKVNLPALLIIGGKDYSLKFPGREEYLNSGKVKEFVPNLEINFLPEGTHFVHEQLPDEVNQLILSFLGKHV